MQSYATYCRLDERHMLDSDEHATAVINELSSLRDSAMETEEFPNSLKNRLKEENQIYFETGSCNPSKKKDTIATNPTLLELK